MTSTFTDPKHYKETKFSPWDVIDVFFLAKYHLGAAFKYMARAGRKPYPGFDALNSELIDTGKAIAELQRHEELLREEISTRSRDSTNDRGD